MEGITFTWQVTSAVRHATTDMIFSMEWELTATQGLNHVSAIGSINLEPSTCPIPFIDLSSELINEWLLEALGPNHKKEIEHGLTEVLNAKANPATLNNMPW